MSYRRTRTKCSTRIYRAVILGSWQLNPPQEQRHGLGSLFFSCISRKKIRTEPGYRHQPIRRWEHDHFPVRRCNMAYFRGHQSDQSPCGGEQEPSGAAHRDQAIKARLHLPDSSTTPGRKSGRCTDKLAAQRSRRRRSAEGKSEGERGGVAARRFPPHEAPPRLMPFLANQTQPATHVF